MRWASRLSAVAVLLSIGAASCGGGGGGQTLTGFISGERVFGPGPTCRVDLPSGGANFVGQAVTITDPAGKVLAKGDIAPWKDDTLCRLPFTVKGVPKAENYTVKVDGIPDKTYTFDELANQDAWTIDLNCGCGQS